MKTETNKKIKIQIKNRFFGNVLFEYESENNTLRETVLEAIKSRADLSDANLSDADLSDANLRGADLRGANLSDADLSDADLSDANLSDADLSDADLSDANLRGADLSDADLSRADLRGADLSDANLRGADLRGANLSDADLSDADLSDADLSDANLSVFKNDIWAILLRSNEVKYLRQSLIDGKVDGSCYEGECCCLVGTIANSKQCKYNDLEKMNGLIPDSSRPAERWFMQINKGMNPENNGVVKMTVEWIDEFEMLLAAK